MYLAVGISYENGMSWSLIVHEISDPQEVAKSVSRHNCNGDADEILVIEKDNVIKHWNLGSDYFACDEGDNE